MMMTVEQGIQLMKKRFEVEGQEHTIPTMRAGRTFTGVMTPTGISVDNLGNAPMLDWDVFRAALTLLIENGVGVPVFKGNAMKGPLGSEHLPYTSVEGYIAHHVFNKREGIMVYHKISAVSGVMVYCGLCNHGIHSTLILRNY